MSRFENFWQITFSIVNATRIQQSERQSIGQHNPCNKETQTQINTFFGKTKQYIIVNFHTKCIQVANPRIICGPLEIEGKTLYTYIYASRQFGLESYLFVSTRNPMYTFVQRNDLAKSLCMCPYALFICCLSM